MLDGLLLSPSQRSSLETATAAYEKHLDVAGSYLAGRGISRDAATGHRLGFVDEPTVQEHERFVGWLSIPYLSVTGVVAIKFRRLDDGHPKYDQPSQKQRLYNSRVLGKGGDVVLVCEGEMDAIMASSVLEVPAVATPGTTWLEHWARCFGDYGRVIVVADHDVKDDNSSPGIKHARKVHADLQGSELVLPPPGLDLSEWIIKSGDVNAVRKGLGL